MENIQEAQDAIVDWFGQAPFKDKYQFMRRLMGTMSGKETKTFQNMANKMRRVSKRKLDQESDSAERVEPAPPTSTESVPPKRTKVWYEEWKDSEIVAIDCEFVILTDEKLKGFKKNGAATVAIVDFKGNTIYAAAVRRLPKDYKVNQNTIKINGITKKALSDPKELKRCGIDFELKDVRVVQQEVDEILKGKLVITHSGVADFESLDLESGDYDHFDVGEFFKRPKFNKYGEDVGEKISLRSLMYHFFKEDLQAGVHSPTTDALAAMKLFRDVYVKNNYGKHGRSFVNYELFEDVKKYTGKK